MKKDIYKKYYQNYLLMITVLILYFQEICYFIKDRLDYSFHINTIVEFMHVVSKEIRIFPIQQPNGKIPNYF